MLFRLPFIIVIQEISARIECVSGRGIADNLRRHYAAGRVTGALSSDTIPQHQLEVCRDSANGLAGKFKRSSCRIQA